MAKKTNRKGTEAKRADKAKYYQAYDCALDARRRAIGEEAEAARSLEVAKHKLRQAEIVVAELERLGDRLGVES